MQPGNFDSKEDSLRFTSSYINNWLRERVILHKAEENLTTEEKDVKRELNDYKNGLLIFRYKQKLIAERLDTVVTEEQVKLFFEKNQKDFESDRTTVRLRFVKLKKQTPEFTRIRGLLFTGNEKNIKKLSDLCEKYSPNFFLDEQTWLDFDEVKKELPVQNYDEEHFLKNNKFLEISEGDYIYLINILDYKVRNNFAMLDPEKDRIRKIILHGRAQALIKEMEINVMKEAELNKEFEIMP